MVFQDIYIANYPVVGYLDYILSVNKFINKVRIREKF